MLGAGGMNICWTHGTMGAQPILLVFYRNGRIIAVAVCHNPISPTHGVKALVIRLIICSNPCFPRRLLSGSWPTILTHSIGT